MPPRKQNCVLTLGSPGSGAATLTGCFYYLGAKLGNAVEELPADLIDPNGEPGYQNLDLALIHEKLFLDLNYSWKNVQALPQQWVESEATQSAKDWIKSWIDRCFKGERLWALNDYRMARALPIWREIFEELGIFPHIVIIMRNPQETAQFLQDQYNLSLDTGLLLWLNYYREIFSFSKPYSHCLVTFDQLLANPVSTLESLSYVLQFEYPLSLQVHTSRIQEFVRPDTLRFHYQAHKSSDSSPPTFFDWLYGQMRSQQLANSKQGSFQSQNFQAGHSASLQKNHHRQVAEIASDLGLIPDQGKQDPISNLIGSLTRIAGSIQEREAEIQKKEKRLSVPLDSGDLLFCKLNHSKPRDNPSSNSAYEDSIRYLPVEEWYEVIYPLPYAEALWQRGLSFEVLNTSGLVSIAGFKITDSTNGKILWSSDPENQFQSVEISGKAILLEKGELLKVLSFGTGGFLTIPPISDLPDLPLSLSVWIFVTRGFADVQSSIQRNSSASEELKVLQEKIEVLRKSHEKETQQLISKNRELESQLETLQKRKFDAIRELNMARQKLIRDLESIKKENREMTSKFHSLKAEVLHYLQILD